MGLGLWFQVFGCSGSGQVSGNVTTNSGNGATFGGVVA